MTNSPKTISLIVAASTDNAIGKNGQLLWHLPDDLKFFKNTTWAMPVIMGRKTFESIGKALPGRTNIVVTRQSDWKAENSMVVSNINDAIQKASTLATNEIFIIGGGQLYKQSFYYAHRIYMTRIDALISDADTFFPNISEKDWQLMSKKDFSKDTKHAFNYSFEVWERKIL